MAVGKGSMERAAKAAEQKAEGTVEKKASAKKTAAPAEKKAAASEKKSASVKKNATKRAPAKKGTEAKVETNNSQTKTVETAVIAAPSKEVTEQIVYQTSSGMLERAAEPNERFGLGDAMPVYYF